MTKLICMIMGQDCSENLKICLESVKESDNIIYCDGGSKDDSIEVAKSFNCEIIQNNFDQSNKEMNGIQRGFYLSYLKEHYKNEYCLCLDADEILDDDGIKTLKKEIKEMSVTEHYRKYDMYDIKMRHFINDFGNEDATLETHFVQRRFFKITDDLYYPKGEHVLLESNINKATTSIISTTIWHLAYAPMQHIKMRYDKNLTHSNIHSKIFLDNWYKLHLFGLYPKKKINLIDLPTALLNYYNIDKDEIYFADRNLETKHFIDMINWKMAFELGTEKDKCDIILIGDGLGHRTLAAHIAGLNYLGTEKSKWAIENCTYQLIKGNYIYDDITENNSLPCSAKLIVVYDVLEHLEYDKLDSAISKIIKHSEKFILISVPVIGNPNLEADKTHIIKESKEWWTQRFLEKGLTQMTVPDTFLYKDQQLIFKVK